MVYLDRLLKSRYNRLIDTDVIWKIEVTIKKGLNNLVRVNLHFRQNIKVDN